MIATLLGELILGWLLADLIGGLLHFVEDRQLLPGWLDEHIGAPNRLHHIDPLAVTRDPSLVRRNWTTWAAALPFVAGLYLLTGPSPLWLSATAGALLSYEVHRWAHGPSSAPAFVRMLQEIGAFQSPKHHAGHHRPPHAGRYCILTDWLNPLLDRTGIWRIAGAPRSGVDPS